MKDRHVRVSESSETTPLVASFNHTSITVSGDDFERVLSFFTNGLGLPLKDKSQRDPKNMEQVTGVPGAEVVIAYVQGPGHQIELINYLKPDERHVPRLQPCDTGFYHLAFNVTDIDAAVAVAIAYQFAPVHEPLPVSAGPNVGNFCVYTRDPQGITVEMIGPRK